MGHYRKVGKVLSAYRHWIKKRDKCINGLKKIWDKVRIKTITELATNPNKENKELLPKYNRLSTELRDKFCGKFYKFRKL